MIVETDLGALRLAEPVPDLQSLTATERAWIAMLRDLGGGTTPPPTLPAVQAVRRALKER